MKLLKRLASSPPMGGMIVAMLFALGAIGVGALEQAFPLSTTAGTIFVRGPLPAGLTQAVGTGTGTALTNGTLSLSASVAGVCTAADLVETDLFSYTLPANSLNATTSRGLRVYTYGTTAANANVKTVKVYFGTNVFTLISGAVNNSIWFTTNTYLRTGASTQQRMGIAGFAGTINAPTIVATSETDTAAIVIKVTGQNGTSSANDICFKGITIETIR